LSKKDILNILEKELPYLKEKFGVRKLALFGSFAKEVPSKNSDIDLLVQLGKPLGLEFIELAHYLEKTLGKKVDLTTFNCFERSKENPRYKHIAVDVQSTLTYV